MIKEYWKKRNIPDKCPVCGAKEFYVPNKSLPSIMNAFYSSWDKELRKHPFWKIPCWYGVCRRCMMTEALTVQKSFLDSITISTGNNNYWQIPVKFGPIE